MTSGYPTLILFTGEKKITFDGDRNLLSIENFFAKELGIKTKEVTFKVPVSSNKKSNPKPKTAGSKAPTSSKKDDNVKKNAQKNVESSGTNYDKSKLIAENNRLKAELKELEDLHKILVENADLKKKIKDLEKLIKTA